MFQLFLPLIANPHCEQLMKEETAFDAEVDELLLIETLPPTPTHFEHTAALFFQ